MYDTDYDTVLGNILERIQGAEVNGLFTSWTPSLQAIWDYAPDQDRSPWPDLYLSMIDTTQLTSSNTVVRIGRCLQHTAGIANFENVMFGPVAPAHVVCLNKECPEEFRMISWQSKEPQQAMNGAFKFGRLFPAPLQFRATFSLFCACCDLDKSSAYARDNLRAVASQLYTTWLLSPQSEVQDVLVEEAEYPKYTDIARMRHLYADLTVIYMQEASSLQDETYKDLRLR